ncbi:C6 domain-containing protein [Caenorhabditis elegans]|uniref:C6 domain-containing protein n=1 Tax=Caenorhabditis elegans TaxID=6239 RepID=O45261_CAEEL|nr:C6 domain-containing protein [Caenorhabditis elegans]CAB03901.1 C6 domain-containing protein [Caenorhabditis elegans]|eukprot:NP_507441.1 Uncharacterized protein CELE_C18D4.3 [Caenorhabditis elegans]
MEDTVSVTCSSNQEMYNADAVATCGVLKVINSTDDFEWYHKQGKYGDSQVGNGRVLASFYTRVFCDSPYEPVAFSENNPPIYLDNLPVIYCDSNPMTNKSGVWVTHGIQLINPATGCMKITDG